MKIWVNGVLGEPADTTVSPFDHGFTVGDGVFETCKVVDGSAFALTRHLQRLARSAAGLALPEPNAAVVRAGVEELIAAEPTAGRLRITYTGGPGPLGSERGTAGTTLVLAVSPAGAWEPSTKVVVVPWTRNERSAVVGLKTTSYAENVVALAYARERGGSEAILGNNRGELCEGTGSNIFVVIGGELLTPRLASGCLAGISRELVLEWSNAREEDIDLSDLTRVDEAFLTSSTRDVQPIHAIDDLVLPGVDGQVAQHAREQFVTASGKDVDP